MLAGFSQASQVLQRVEDEMQRPDVSQRVVRLWRRNGFGSIVLVTVLLDRWLIVIAVALEPLRRGSGAQWLLYSVRWAAGLGCLFSSHLQLDGIAALVDFL